MDDSKFLMLQGVCNKFRIKGTMQGYDEIKVGHINDTYYVHYLAEDGEKKTYVAQRINMYVFKNPRHIMSNVDLITTHIREKSPNATLHFHHTENGKNYFVTAGSFWRVYTYVDGTIYDDSSAEGMRSAGEAFGQFQMYLSDFDASLLKETIPNFHNTRKRVEMLFSDIIDDPCGRVEFAKEDILFANQAAHMACRISDLQAKGKFPVRVTHNDTKTNNVLLDRDTKQPKCVIDLDTVMPGLIMHDFGDAIRYGANTAAEDEANLFLVHVDMERYRAFTEGFIGKVGKILTKEELDCMALGAYTITVELGIRFLDDYICGDQYFKINYPEHNLVRARCQFALAKEMETRMDEMNAIVQKVYHNL